MWCDEHARIDHTVGQVQACTCLWVSVRFGEVCRVRGDFGSLFLRCGVCGGVVYFFSCARR